MNIPHLDRFMYVVIGLAFIGFFLYGTIAMFFEATQTGWSKIDPNVTYLNDPRHPVIVKLAYGAGSMFYFIGMVGAIVALWRGMRD